MEPLLGPSRRQTPTLKDRSEIQFFSPEEDMKMGKNIPAAYYWSDHELSWIMDVLKHRQAYKIQKQHIWRRRQRGGVGGAYFHRDNAH